MNILTFPQFYIILYVFRLPSLFDLDTACLARILVFMYWFFVALPFPLLQE